MTKFRGLTQASRLQEWKRLTRCLKRISDDQDRLDAERGALELRMLALQTAEHQESGGVIVSGQVSGQAKRGRRAKANRR